MSNIQRVYCEEKGVVCKLVDSQHIMGIADNMKGGVYPIHGLRHPSKSNTCGWYIWAGEELSQQPDFFKPHHVQHLIAQYPEIEKFLGLPPGWRFLYTPDDEDVWYDESLLHMS